MKLPTVQQIIAVIANVGDEVHLDSADDEGYYEGQELEFYVTDRGQKRTGLLAYHFDTSDDD